MESVPVPLIIISLASREIIAANSLAIDLLRTDRQSLVGHRSSTVVPDYLLPEAEVVLRWIEDQRSGAQAGLGIDLLVEKPSTEPVRVNAHLAPFDVEGESILVTFQGSGSAESGAMATPGSTPDAGDALLRLMGDIGRIAGSSLDLEAVCQRFAISLMHVVPAEHVAILLKSSKQDEFDLIFSTGAGNESKTSVSAQLPPLSRSVSGGSAVVLDSAEIGEIHKSGAMNWPVSDWSSLKACTVPLITNEVCVGVVLLASASGSSYSPSDLALLEHSCNQVAGAISNVKLREQLEQHVVEKDTLANIGRLASAATDFDRAISGIAAEVQRYMPITELSVAEPDGISGVPSITYTWQETRRSADESAVKSEDGSSEQFDDRQASTIRAPLRFGGQEIGTLIAVSPDGYRYADREKTFINLVAGQIAGSVHTARAYRSQQREASLRRTLAHISLAASRDLTPQSVFERIGSEVAELVEYDLLAIALQTPDYARVRVRFHIGEFEVATLYESEDSESGEAGDEWREQIVDDLESDPRFAALASRGLESILEVSLGTKENGPIGFLLVGSTRQDAFTNHDLTTLANVALQVTSAIQNATAHEQAVALAEARMAEARAEARNLELERINDAKSRFLSVVSHELRTPLTSIIAYAELLERNMSGNMDVKQVQQASVINKSATHLKFLISDLLDVSRIESGNLSLEMSTFDLGEVVNDVVEQFEPVLHDKQQEFDVHIARESIHLNADRSRIFQVISNLVENASKYSPPDTVITVNTHRRGSDAVITVSDEGFGISEEDQKQLFVPFFRANSELTRNEPGTGLGLALVKSIAELHSGSVSVKSSPGTGSSFSVVLRTAASEQAA